MFTLNGVRNGAGKGAPVINGGKYAQINGNRPYEYDKWRMMWNGNHLAPPEPSSVLYFPGYPGTGTTIHDFSEVGGASDVLRQSDDSAKNGTDASYVASGLTLTVTQKLTSVRIKFDLASLDDVQLAYGKIYKNGIAVGTERSNLDTWTTYSEDFTTLVPGDIITVWAHGTAGEGWAVRRLRIYYSYNDGTITGAAWVRSNKGIWGLNFDGTDDVVSVASAASLTGLFGTPGGTILAWVNPDTDGETDFGAIVAKHGNWSLRVREEVAGFVKLRFAQNRDGTSGVWSTNNAVVPIGTPSLVAVTYNDATVGNDPVIYVNGASVAITETIEPDGAVTADAGLAVTWGDRSISDAAYDGKIYMGRLLKTTLLSAAQIASTYSQERTLLGV